MSVTVNLPNLAEYTYSYYVWNNFDNMIAIGNNAPAKPENLLVSDVSTSTVKLSWDEAEDDVKISKYVIYRDGDKVGVSDTTSYTDTGLDYNTSYTYYVVAQDELGAVSPETQTVTAKTNDIAYINFENVSIDASQSYIGSKTDGYLTLYGASASSQYIADGLAYPNHYAANNGSDVNRNFWSIEEFDGKMCYSSSMVNQGAAYGMRVGVDNSFITADDTTVTFIFTYYDNGTDGIWLYYRTADSPTAGPVKAITKTGTNTWKTAAYTVTDVAFAPESGAVDLYIVNPREENLYISELGVTTKYVKKAEAASATTPTNLSVISDDVTTSTIPLTWYAPLDDEGITGYNVYRDGVLVGFSETTSYIDVNLDYNTEYTYKVSSVNVDGSETMSDSVTGMTARVEIFDFTGVNTTLVGNYAGKKTQGLLSMEGIHQNAVYVPEGLAATGNTANTWSVQEFDGRTCYTSYANINNAAYGIRMAVNNDFVTANDNEVTFIFTYYDNGTGDISLYYRTADNSTAGPVTAVTKTGTNEWKTSAFTITDAAFAPASGVVDFYVMNFESEILYLSELGVTTKYVPKAE